MKTLLRAISALSFALVAEAIWQHFEPPFTDVQLASQGIVDTWQSHALVTTAILAFLTVVALFLTAFLFLGNTKSPRGAAFELVAIAAAGCSQIAVHVELTRQVMRVTGESFGGFYGLF